MASSVTLETFHETIQGISRLVRRFEQLKPVLKSLPTRDSWDIIREGDSYVERLSKIMQIMHTSSTGVLPAVQDGHLFGLNYGFSVCLLRAERLLGSHANVHNGFN